jgi:NhaA family Na+:H+ antiporter
MQPSHAPTSGPARVLAFVYDKSLLLILGTVTALVWANVDLEQYHAATHVLHFVVNDVGMVFFFAIAAKEVFEATLPGGPLSSPREAGVPLLAAVGGMAVPASIYLLMIQLEGRPELHAGWAIPCATDIAFSYLVARLIFRAGHPAIPFLLLLAIADDAMGLIVLAVFYPSGEVSLGLLFALLLPAVAVAWVMRRRGISNFWWYLLGPGALSWLALFLGGLHPALALVPIVPFMPHPSQPVAVFGRPAPVALDAMNTFEHWWKVPVQYVLMAFGLVNAGVPLGAVGPITWIVLVALLLGKPLGVVVTTFLAERLGFRRAAGLDYRSLVVLGIAAGIGFTVALFFATAAFPAGEVLDEAKMGALLSFGGSAVAIIVARLFGIRRST